LFATLLELFFLLLLPPPLLLLLALLRLRFFLNPTAAKAAGRSKSSRADATTV
jgi:hypothetical protein